jgi:hypothetical protein
LTDIGKHVELLRNNVSANLPDLIDRVSVMEYKWYINMAMVTSMGETFYELVG